MWKPVSLRYRILIMLSALVTITVGGGLASIWHTCMMERMLVVVIEDELPGLETAQKLKTSLVMQKGYVTYYFQDGDANWLTQLTHYNQSFDTALRTARSRSRSDPEREILNQIESEYINYAHSRDEVIALYSAGSKKEGFDLHKSVRTDLFRIIGLCDQFQKMHEEIIGRSRRMVTEDAERANQLALMALVTVFCLAVILAYTLIRNILGPIRALAMGPEPARGREHVEDEIKAIGGRLEKLMQDVQQTKSKLEWSRGHLQQAEKLAMVGKLAAGVAHTVRNPLTSVKMRLFSLERTLTLKAAQREDFEVISEEIRHVDKIINNFIEFARPPKLVMRPCNASEAVDTALQLLKHRLESYNVTVVRKRSKPVPLISADPDRLKEVMVNLIVNACEAMVYGGTLTIEESVGESEKVSPAVIIKFSDTGPGVTETVQAKIFQPFFTTKEEGTGLGLSIATRIVEEHGGWLDLEPHNGPGASFVITLPTGEERIEDDPDN
ncbi:MAG: ATP-binding protein [Pseudomonadota bacterium]